MASELRVDKIVPVDGVASDSGSNPLYLGAGGVVQVVYAQTKTQQSTTSSGFTDATNMFVDITPKFSTSKMLIEYHTVGQVSGTRARFDIHKSTTNSRISAHAADNRPCSPEPPDIAPVLKSDTNGHVPAIQGCPGFIELTYTSPARTSAVACAIVPAIDAGAVAPA